MKIGDLAKAGHCEVETIRYYEKEGLLPKPARTDSGYRVYQPRHLDQLLFIRHCRAFGMSLSVIRQLLTVRQQPEASCAAVNELLDEQLQLLEQQMLQLQQLQSGLITLRGQCQQVQSVRDCEILKNLVQPCPDECNGNVTR